MFMPNIKERLSVINISEMPCRLWQKTSALFCAVFHYR